MTQCEIGSRGRGAAHAKRAPHTTWAVWPRDVHDLVAKFEEPRRAREWFRKEVAHVAFAFEVR